MPAALLKDADKIIKEITKIDDLDQRIEEFYQSMGEPIIKEKTLLETIVFFDLDASTLLKSEVGHDKAMRKILIHDKLCRTIVKRLEGKVIKETGDGLCALFTHPLNACIAAINVKEIANAVGISTKAALVLGLIEKNKLGSQSDVFGTAVDICSRIEKCALPNQLLISRSLYDSVHTFLKPYDDVLIGHPMSFMIRGYGKLDLYEISSKKFPLKNHLKTPFYINEQGRFTIEEKKEFIQNAESEIIQVGMGLNQFTNYLRDSVEFKNLIKLLLQRGVNFKCLAADPSSFEKIKSDDYDSMYIQEINNNLNKLKEFQKDLKDEKAALFEVLVCKKPPTFRATCVDADQESGRMIVSNYLNGIDKLEHPDIQFSKSANPVIFKTYLSSINYMLKNSHPW